MANYSTLPAKRTKSIPVFNDSGRMVGEVVEGLLQKHVKPSHQLKSPAGWAWDKSILIRAEELGVRETELILEGKTLRANLEDFWAHGVELDRGYGVQVCLPVKYWQCPSDPHQLSLFG